MICFNCTHVIYGDFYEYWHQRDRLLVCSLKCLKKAQKHICKPDCKTYIRCYKCKEISYFLEPRKGHYVYICCKERKYQRRNIIKSRSMFDFI